MVPIPFPQINCESFVKHGAPPTIIVGFTDVQIPAAINIHGCGVSTPRAAAVADATCGFASEVHIPNGAILTFAAVSLIVAIGLLHPRHVICDVAFIDAGAVPNVHCNIPPDTTAIPIFSSHLRAAARVQTHLYLQTFKSFCSTKNITHNIFLSVALPYSQNIVSITFYFSINHS